MEKRNTEKSKWALVTGASSGIGEEFARQLAKDGWNLVLAARRKELTEAIGKKFSSEYNIQHRVIQADLAKTEGTQLVIDKTNDLEIEMLISNAGTGEVGKFVDRNIEDLYDRIQLNAVSHLTLTHHFGKKMALKKRGSILLTGAMGAVEGMPYMATEAATKGFIEALGKSLHTEFQEFGINITVLVTTPTETPVFYKLGFTLENSPVKPLTMKQCVMEALDALSKNKIRVYPGLKFRIMRVLTPETLQRKMFAKILLKNNNIN